MAKKKNSAAKKANKQNSSNSTISQPQKPETEIKTDTVNTEDTVSAEVPSSNGSQKEKNDKNPDELQQAVSNEAIPPEDKSAGQPKEDERITALNSKIEEQNNKVAELEAELKDLELPKEPKKDSHPANGHTESGNSELEALRNELEIVQGEKEDIEEQYQSLLEKISQVRTTLGERLKADAEELENYRNTVEGLEKKNKEQNDAIYTLQNEVIAANRENDEISKELSKLRKEQNEAEASWSQEREDLMRQIKAATRSAQESTLLAQNLEITLEEERALKGDVSGKINELEEQLSEQTNFASHYKKELEITREELKLSKEQLTTISLDLSGKIDELETEKRKLLATIDNLQQELTSMNETFDKLKNETETVKKLESEVKEKGLIIGKLRHEAVVLNEHLTKALSLIKKNSEGETIDKQLISNLILSFVNFPRGDTKKFEVLRLMSDFLSWDEEQKAQAGLTRAGTSISGAPGRGIGSPPPRSASASSIALEPSSGGFMGLFAEFLERESQKKRT